jgi:hypothetical protein
MKWTIAMVNWRMEDYLRWQLKILYEFNTQADFQLVIVDNTFELNPDDYDYPNLKIIEGEEQSHAGGLNRVLSESDSDFFLAQDPDFFWRKKDYLNWMEELLEDHRTVGAEYGPFAEGRGLVADAHFPAAYGCAFHLSDIKYLNFSINNSLWKDGKDVGWKMRQALTDKPFVYFPYQKCDCPKFGNFGWDDHEPANFVHNEEIVATHMQRGTYSIETITNEEIPLDWKTVRNQYGKYFYENSSLLS